MYIFSFDLLWLDAQQVGVPYYVLEVPTAKCIESLRPDLTCIHDHESCTYLSFSHISVYVKLLIIRNLFAGPSLGRRNLLDDSSMGLGVAWFR